MFGSGSNRNSATSTSRRSTHSALDAFKQKLPDHLGPKSINQHLILIRATLRFLWKRGKLRSVPYVPMEAVTKPHVDWYTKQERDQLLEGMFRLDLTEDILAAVDWHVSAGYAGPEFLFSRTSVFPRYIDNEALFAEAHGNLAATAAQGHGEAASPAPPA
jgi:hypothetical protein